MPTPNNGTVVSISNTPQAKDDVFGATEDRIVTFDVMANDLGGNGKSMYSVDQSNPLHIALTATSHLGAAISIVNGKVVYDSTGAHPIEALAAGQTAVDTFQYVIQLGNGALSVATVSVTVTGTNDGPTLSADPVATHTFTEVAGATGSTAADTASTSLAFTDVDLNDTHTATIGAPSATWSAGTTPAATLTALGSALTSTVHDSTGSGAGSIGLAFSAADKAFDFLGQGETLTVTYNVTVTDNNGATSTTPVTFVVTGTNDGPVVAADAVASHAIAEAAGATGSATADTASATLNFTDVDLTDTHSVTLGAPSATWAGGTVPAATLTALGSALSSTLSDSNGSGAGSVALSFSAADKAFDFLGQGETLTVTYDVTVTDSHNVASTKSVTFTVTGANDAPVLAADASGPHAIGEAAGVTGSATPDTASATLNFTDVDLTDTHTVTIGAPTATWADGTVPAATLSALNGALGSTLTDSNGSGAGSVALAFSAADKAFDFLGERQTLTVTYDVTVTDSHNVASTQQVTVTVTGTNDAPVVAADAVASHAVAEAGGASGSAAADTATATLSFTDVDLTDHHTATVGTPSILWTAPSAPPGTDTSAYLPSSLAGILAHALTTSVADSDGTGAGAVTANFSAPDSSFDFLGVNDTLTVTYDVTVDDGHGGTATKPVTVTVSGAEDPVILAADASGPHVIHELANARNFGTPDTATAQLTFTDLDLSDEHTVSIGAPTAVWSAGGGVPAATLTALQNALNYNLDDSSGSGSGSVTLNFGAQDRAFDFLAQGETLTVTYDVTVDDGHGGAATQPVTITVVGTNDTPVLSAQASLEHVVNGGFEQGAFGWSTLSDAIEVNPASTYNVSGASGLVLELDANATLPRDDVFQSFATTAGQAYSFSFDTALRSGTTPADNTFEVLWNGVVIDTVTAHSTAMEHHSYTVFGDGAADKFEFRELTTNNNSLGGIIDNVSVKSAIGEQVGQTGAQASDTASVTLALTDVDLNDSHTIGRGSTQIVWSGGGTLPAGLSTAIGNALTTSLADTTGTGTGSLTATFAAADSTFDFLAQGETLTVTYTLAVDDGHGGVVSRPVTFVVTGTNDGPVLGTQGNPVTLGEQVGVTGATTADAGATIFHFTDADLNDHHTASVGAPSVAWSGGAVLPAGLAAQLTGALTTAVTDFGTGAGTVVANFAAPDKAFDFMSQGETLTVTYNVAISDGHGGTSSQPVTVTINGRDDAPVLAADPVSNHALSEAANAIGSAAADTASATLSFTDVDLNDSHTVSLGAPSATWSGGAVPSATLTALQNALHTTAFSESAGAGALSVGFSAADSAFDFLADGQTLKVTYDVTVTDSQNVASTQQVTFTVTGANDAPTLAAQAATPNLVVNGGFEQSNPALPGFGWANPAPGGVEINRADVYGVSGATGNVMEVDNAASTTLDDVSQSVQTVAGQAYNFSFDIAARTGFPGATNTVQVIWNGQVIDTVTPGSTVMAHHSYTVFGDGAADKFEFREVTSDGAGGIIDNVSLKAAIGEQAGQTGSQSQDTGSVTLALTDVDLSDTHTISRGPIGIAWSGGPNLPAGLATTIGNALTTSLSDTNGTGTGSLTATFAAPDAAFDFLGAGETLTVTYNLTVDDGHGGTSSQPVTFVVTGTDDAPVLAAQAAPIAVNETANTTGSNALHSGSTVLAFTDLDLNDHHSVAVGAPTFEWSGGATVPAATLTLFVGSAITAGVTQDSTGSGAGSVTVTYNIADRAVDFLAPGETLKVTYSVTVDDGHGGASVQPVTLVFTGADDAPVLNILSGGATIFEAAGVTGSAALDTSTAQLVFTDVDLHDTHTPQVSFLSATVSAGAIPAAVLSALQNDAHLSALVEPATAASGTVGLTFSAADSTFDFLGAGQVLSVTYNVTVTDASGLSSTKPVVFVINGANDAPVAPDHLGMAVNAATGTVSFDGLTGASDVDQNSTLSVTNVTSLPAGVIFNAATHTFSLDTSNPAYANLGVGQTTTVAVDYSVTDGITSTPTHASWVVTGVNGAPVVTSSDLTGAILEADRGTAPTAPTTPVFTDVEPNNSMATAETISVAAMRVSANPDLYDQSVPALAITGTVSASTDVDYYRIDLKAGQLLTLDVDTHTSPLKLDSFMSLFNSAGNLIVSNDDSNVTVGGAGSLVNQDSFLQFTVQTTGTYYIALTDFVGPGGTETSTGAYTLNVSVNDQSGALTDAGTINFTDNKGDTHTVTVTPMSTGYLGTVSATVTDDTAADTTGRVDWQFSVPAADVQFLAQGQVVNQAYDLAIRDSAGNITHQTVNVAITGVNDTPLFTTGDTEATNYLAPAHTVSGVLNFTDVDLTDTHTLSFTQVQAGAGTFTTYLIKDSTGTGTGEIYWQLDTTNGGAGGSQRYDITLTDNHGASVDQLITLVNAGAPPTDALDNTLTATAGADTLTGGAGNDVFVFQPGTVNGDHITDFAGHSFAPGDTLEFQGFGAGATFTQTDATHWQITYNGGASHETLTFDNGASPDPSDVVFMHQAQLLSNFSFENGTTGWTNVTGVGLEIVGSGFLGIAGSDGHMLDTQATPGGITISQNIDVATGAHATLSVNLAAELSGSTHPGSSFVLTWDGVVVKTITEADFKDANGNMQWNTLKTFTVDVVGQAGNDSLQIHDTGTGSVGYALDWARVDAWVVG